MHTRAKVRVESVKHSGSDGQGGHLQEEIQFRVVMKDKYDETGLDENNTYARFSPSLDIRLTVTNPAVFGFFKPEAEHYVDFIPATTQH